jgi:hypothetical protein
MDYLKIYNTLCERGRLRNKRRGSNLEKHHIIPTFFFKDSKRNHRYKDGIFNGDGEGLNNITYLTPREHFISHLLLCKIWKGTKWEYRCYCSLKMFVNGGQVNKKRSVFEYSSRKYEYYKTKANAKISEGKSGTMPAKDAITGERVGIVSVEHPNVISEKWVHITKGIKKSKEQKLKQSFRSKGLSNAKSKYTDNQLIESFRKCCYECGVLVNHSFWISYSLQNDLPHLKFFKDFRFSGNGFSDLVEIINHQAKNDGIKLKIMNHKSKEWKEFIRKEKAKWL